uniref:Anion exchange protein n=1 Tax=Esox lucius TaxID=8010 RepID=A0A3P8Z3N1_ESOLU
MENNLSFGEDGMSYEEESAFPSPIRTPPGHSGSYDLEQSRQDEGSTQAVQTVHIQADPEACLNINTNANTRGDAQAYVELNELIGNSWEETGRWVGYEENLNPATGVWGPSHVPYLTFKSLIQVRRFISTGAIILDLQTSSLSGVAEKIVDELQSKGEIRPTDREGLLRALLQRRSQSDGAVSPPTGVDIQMQTFSVTKQRDTTDRVEASIVLSGLVESLDKPVVAFVRLEDSVVMEGALEAPVPVRFVFVLVGPSQGGLDYHESGRAMATLMADWVFSLEVFLAKNDKEVTDAIADFMDCSIVIPPTEIQNESMLQPIINFQKKMLKDRLRPTDTRIMFGHPREDPLARTGYPFGGMIKDIKRRYRHYLSDFTDALNPQVLAAVIFIYFAALSPAITFGGLLGEVTTRRADKTDQMMGVSELMISTCIQGIIFAFIAAQPTLVIGFSGPLLVFEEAFYGFCKSNGMEYIVGRIWVGLWLVIIVILIVALEGSFLVRFISRFTQEIFSILISLIFIYETFSKLIKIFKTHPLILNYEHLNDTLENPFHPVIKEHVEFHDDGNTTMHEIIHERAYPNTALLSMCLMFGCFFIAYFLRQFKNGHFLPGPIRRIIGDFGVPIAIFFMIAVDITIEDAYTQKLVVPKGLEVTKPSARGWFINPMGEKKAFPIWMMGACCVPALLVFILIFLESQITTKPERKMVKGSGFHLDLLILVTMGGLASLFGVPWLSAATVRSVTHANALTVMSKGPKPEIEKGAGAKGQRYAGVLFLLFPGVSILLEPILKMIPMTALFGIFLYMGITSLSGIQMWERILLLIVPRKYYPPEAYAQRVSTMKMHLYTMIQVGCLAVLWIVKMSPFSLALPFVLILTIPLRMVLTGTLFTKMEIKCLDAADAKVTFEEEPGEDMYNESPLP